VLFLISAIKVAREYERGIIFRLGRLLAEPKGPGRAEGVGACGLWSTVRQIR